MHDFIIFLILMFAGGVLSILSVFAGAFIMYRGKIQPGSGEGFLKNPKGDVFTIPDTDALDFPQEPNRDEQNILKRTERFLKTIGGNSG